MADNERAREENLRKAALAGDIDILYKLIGEDPKLLVRIDDIPFKDTPLHVAAEAGCTHFAIEMMRLNPSFSRKLNPAGLSPLDLALRQGHTNTVRRLVEIDNELVRVKGKESWTPLHYVAKIDHTDLLAHFLLACPRSIDDVTNQQESAVHIAVANGRTEALKVLMGWLFRTHKEDVLRWKDDRDNTLLHIAAYTNQFQVFKTLSKKITKAEKNSENLTALDIILRSQLPKEEKEEAKKIFHGRRSSDFHNLDEFLSSPEKIAEKVLRYDIDMKMGVPMEMVNALLVVAALIVTASYQAALQPPTSFAKFINSNFTRYAQQKSFDITKASLEIFLVFNTMTFALSTAIVIYLLKFTLGSIPVHIALLSLYLNYILLVLFRDVSEISKILSMVTFFINYCILYGRLFMHYLFEKKNIKRRHTFFFGESNIARLEMQQLTVGSKYSGENVHQKGTNS